MLSKQKLGTFGEFVYAAYAEGLGLSVEASHIREHDFLVRANGVDYKIDVKASLKYQEFYSGTRSGPDIFYDLVIVDRGLVFLFPDNGSPLELQISGEIGSYDEWDHRWQDHKVSGKKIHRSALSGLYRKHRRDLVNDIVGIVRDAYGCKVRGIHRGAVSESRWGDHPDNLPGNDSIISAFKATAFVQLSNSGDTEVVKRIYLIPHDLLPNIPMASPSPRQIKKGISKVVDLEKFESMWPDLVFDSKDDLASRIAINCLVIAKHETE